MARSKIEWCDAVWQPTIGCSKVSSACDNCWAERMAKRLASMADADMVVGRHPGMKANYKEVITPEGKWRGEAMCVSMAMDIPLRWKKPRRIFVTSMGDLFHPTIPEAWIEKVWQVMYRAKHHKFLVLTKRAERMCEIVSRLKDGSGKSVVLPNVGLGVTVESYDYMQERILPLLHTPAAMRFVSYEPALGPVDFRPALGFSYRDAHEGYLQDVPAVDWIICGGESGPGARPMEMSWAVDVQKRCEEAGVAFMFKQWGAWRPSLDDFTITDPKRHVKLNGIVYERVGKKKAGRTLNGKEYTEYPEGWE